ncbi:MAG: hypothetical protein LKI53_00015 [Bacteroidales bacterium]|jgi:hypothetical protein|nr:hypothetical protein [Bacteroidales bacterium]
MKNIKYITCLMLAISLFSCKRDPWSDIADGSWNHQRTILGISFEGQAGTPEITNTDASTGTIDVSIATDLVADLSKVKINSLQLSYNAASSVTTGQTLDFSSGNAQITVTSENNDARTYTINMSEFNEDLTGIYDISALYIYGGTGPEYGGAALVAPELKSWCWNTAGEGPEAEKDNTLTFTLSSILDNGNTTGTCVNDAGNDGKYWDCIFAAKMNRAGTGDLDLSGFYRKIPKGTSTWIRNYNDGSITFTSEDGTVTTSSMLEPGTYTIGSKTLKLTSRCFNFILHGADDWANIYSDYDVFAKNPRNFLIVINKR